MKDIPNFIEITPVVEVFSDSFTVKKAIQSHIKLSFTEEQLLVGLDQYSACSDLLVIPTKSEF